jgi:geranylgeranyl diphosphate synthase, type I
MTLPTAIQTTLHRHQQQIDSALRSFVNRVVNGTELAELHTLYGQMQYHFGWVDTTLQPIQNTTGKLLRPTLTLLAYEAAGAWGQTPTTHADTHYLQRAIPAAVALELTHNFTLIHDDIEDGDSERRHRPTLWTIWNTAQAINTGDALFALARLALWDLLELGVDPALAAQLSFLLDRTVLTTAEGQHLDLSAEDRQSIPVATYLALIQRKTAALMSCATEMGARLGTNNTETIERLRTFGNAIGIAFQVRDDLLGIWATQAELGKTQAGDIYHRKKTLPILHALEHANTDDRLRLQTIYHQERLTPTHVDEVLAIFAHTKTEVYCRTFLQEQCQRATLALSHVPTLNNSLAQRALQDMQTLVDYVAVEALP